MFSNISFSWLDNFRDLYHNYPVYFDMFGEEMAMNEIGFFPVLPLYAISSFFKKKQRKRKLGKRFLISLAEVAIFVAFFWGLSDNQNTKAAMFFTTFAFIELLIFTATKWLINKGYIS